jgi:DNA-binding transcriptional LysR family regulator
MFTPELADGTVQRALAEWQLPSIDLWAVYPAGRIATAKARTFVSFVDSLMANPAAPSRIV